MRIVVIVLLLLGAHFSLTVFAPAQAGKAMFYWPFAHDSKPILNNIGGLLKVGESIVTSLLGAVAGLSFLAAVITLFGWVIPAYLWPVLVIVGALASILLYILYFGIYSLVPIAIDAVLLWGVLVQHWTVSGLRSS